MPLGAVPGLIAANENGEQVRAPEQMGGEAARKYLQQPGEGQSLMKAVTAASSPQFFTEPDASLMRKL